jgi:hypothetical protein
MQARDSDLNSKALVGSSQRMAPAKGGEAGIVPVGGDPLTTLLDGKRGKERIGHQVSLCGTLQAQSSEDVPVPWPRADRHALRRGSNFFSEGQRLLDRARIEKDPAIGDDPKKAAQYEVGQSIGAVAGKKVLQPSSVAMWFSASGRWA